MLANHAIAWMLTYLLHSTLLLGLAWLVSKPLSRWSVAAEESVWKLALVGALFTASLQFAAAGWEPLAGRWGLASGPAEPAVSASVLVSGERNAALPAPSFRTEIPRVKIADAPAPAPAPAFRMPSVPSLALGVWALGAGLLLAGYGASFLRLRRRLRPRPRVIGGTLFSQLRTMALEAGFVDEIRLSCSSRVPVPLALGLRRGEICVPPRALAGLTAEQQEGMLAHELAHLARRDPFWLTVSNLVSSILFFQPLNWVARHRMREISEMLSDEWAVSRTGRPLSLAGCLAEVAGWSVAPRPLPVPSMADRPSHLAQRIRRLLDDTRSPEKPARRWLLGTAMVALVIAVAAAAPAISAARPDSPEPERAAVLAALDTTEPPAAEEKAPQTEARHRDDADDDDEDFNFEFDEEKFEQQFERDFEQEFEKEFAKFDQEFEFEFEHEFDQDFEFDFDVDVDSIVARAMASADAAMLGMRQGDARYEGRELTGEEREKLAREIERATREAQRISERVQREMAPQMERLAREMSEKLNDSHSAEMEKLAAEMSKLGERMRPSPEEMARLHAQARKYREDGVLSREERERIGREAREMAERMRPSEEDRQRMRELREKMMKERAEMRSKFMAEHRGEIERSQREMRDEIERHMQGVREEIRRSMEQRRHELRENRDGRERERRREQSEDRQRERERRREQIEERQRERERRQELQRERLERDRDREDGDKDSSGPSL